jgi:uncharacterized membrane protein
VQPPPSKLPGVLYGIGLGGFVDGIVLHQLLQWHHMVSDVGSHPVDTVAGLEVNTLADGFFHLATWFFVLAASLATLRSWVLGIHHVRDDLGGPLSWDLGFLAFGGLLVAGGWALQSRGARAASPSATLSA